MFPIFSANDMSKKDIYINCQPKKPKFNLGLLNEAQAYKNTNFELLTSFVARLVLSFFFFLLFVLSCDRVGLERPVFYLFKLNKNFRVKP